MIKKRTATTIFSALLLWSGTILWTTRTHAQPPKSKSDINVKVGETDLITSSRGYCWFPNIYRLSDGELFVKLRLDPDTTAPESSFAAFSVSRDGGKSWSPRVSEGNMFSPGLLENLPNGETKLIGLDVQPLPSVLGQSKDLTGALLEVSDGWSVITHRRGIQIILPEPAAWKDVDRSNGGMTTQLPAMVFHGCILPSQDGGLLVPMCGKFKGDKYYRSLLMKSMDEGHSWSYVSTIAKTDQPWPGMGAEGPNEPGLARLADGRLICLLRTGFDGLMYQTWSADDGKTWTEPISSGMKGVDPQVRVLSNGVLACTSGRPGPVSIAFSLDGTGKVWSHQTAIFTEMSTRYTGFLEVAPNHLLVVYDHVPYGWKPIPPTDKTSVNEVCGTFIDVE